MSMTEEIYKMIGELSYEDLKEVHKFISSKFNTHKESESKSETFMAQCKLGYYEDRGAFKNLMLFKCNNFYKVHRSGSEFIVTGEKGFVKTFDACEFDNYFNVSDK